MAEGFPSKEAREVLEWILSFMYVDIKKLKFEEIIMLLRQYQSLIDRQSPRKPVSIRYSEILNKLASGPPIEDPDFSSMGMEDEKNTEFEHMQKKTKEFFEAHIIPLLEKKPISKRENGKPFIEYPDAITLNPFLGLDEKGMFQYWDYTDKSEHKIILALFTNLQGVSKDLFNRCQECGKWFLAKRRKAEGVKFCSSKCNWRYSIREKRKKEK